MHPEPSIAPPDGVTLREIAAADLAPILRLEVAPGQEGLVASNAVSIAQAHYSELAWFRAIYAGQTAVGFVMLSLDEHKPEYYLWRLMIGAAHQGCGYGRAAVTEVVRHVRGLPGARELLVGVVQREGGPQEFYERLGFRLTGEFDEDEAILRLEL